MELTIPKLLSIPFADEGQKNAIPNIVTAPSSNLASYRDGFPAVTMVPRAAGGQPPLGQDMNGVLNEISSHIVYQNIGGQYRFDAELVTLIDGYPKGVVLQSDDGKSSYVSAVENNTSNFNENPETIGSAWLPYSGEALRSLPDFTSEGDVLTLRVVNGVLTAVWDEPSSGFDSFPVGTPMFWTRMDLPSDKWMIMNGDILDDPVKYAMWFSLYGNRFGGDGILTSALPDDRGLVWRGLDLGRGYDIDRILGSEQMDMVGAVTGSVIGNAIGLPSQLTGLAGGSSLNHVTAASLFTRTGAETTMKNRAWLGIVKIL